MLQFKKIFKNKKNIFLLFLLIIVILIVKKLFLTCIESFGSDSTSALAFETPSLKKWMFETSRNRWYRVIQSSLFQMSTLGFTDRNPKFSASFLFTCNSGSTSWRNIFRFSNTTTIPPDWYTGAAILKADGFKPTLQDQLEALRKNIVPALQAQVYDDLFLKGTTGN